MPGVIRAAVSVGTLPYSLSTKFSESRAVQMNMNEYHDGSCQRVSLVTGSRRTWKLSKRLDAFHLGLLRAFCNTVQGGAFQFYNPFETLPAFSKNPIGTSGLYLVRFNNDWSQINGMGRSDCDLEIVEVSPTGAIDIGAPIVPDVGPGPGDDGGGGTPPPTGTYALYVSDSVTSIGAGNTGTFAFTLDAAPIPSWIATVNVTTDGFSTHPSATNPSAHLTVSVSSNLTPSSLGSFFSFADTETTVLGPNTGVQSDGVSKTLYPLVSSSVNPAFQYSIDSVDATEMDILGFHLSVVEIFAPTQVRVGWPRAHPESGFLYSLYDDLAAYAGRISVGFTPEQSAFSLRHFDVVATQALSFSSITLRLIAMDSYFPTTDVPTPSEISLAGRTGAFTVHVGTNTYTASLGVAPATITLPSAVSAAVGDTVISLKVSGASSNWLDADYETAPFPLISVLLS